MFLVVERVGARVMGRKVGCEGDFRGRRTLSLPKSDQQQKCYEEYYEAAVKGIGGGRSSSKSSSIVSGY